MSWEWALHLLHRIQSGWAGGGASPEGAAAVVGCVDGGVGAGESEDGDGAGDEAGEGEGGDTEGQSMWKCCHHQAGGSRVVWQRSLICCLRTWLWHWRVFWRVSVAERQAVWTGN